MDTDFKYKLGDKVSLIETEECGTIIGRSEYMTSENSYYIRYKTTDGRQVLLWWGESHIVAN